MDPNHQYAIKNYRNYKNGRYCLILALVFTLVNCVIKFFSNAYFVFSLLFLYRFIDVPGLKEGDIISVAMLITGVVIFIGYIFLLVISFKNNKPMLFICIFFGIDCLDAILVLIASSDLMMLLDIVIHAYLMYVFIKAYLAGKYLNKLSPKGVRITLNEIHQMFNSPTEDTQI